MWGISIDTPETMKTVSNSRRLLRSKCCEWVGSQRTHWLMNPWKMGDEITPNMVPRFRRADYTRARRRASFLETGSPKERKQRKRNSQIFTAQHISRSPLDPDLIEGEESLAERSKDRERDEGVYILWSITAIAKITSSMHSSTFLLCLLGMGIEKYRWMSVRGLKNVCLCWPFASSFFPFIRGSRSKRQNIEILEILFRPKNRARACKL